MGDIDLKSALYALAALGVVLYLAHRFAGGRQDGQQVGQPGGPVTSIN